MIKLGDKVKDTITDFEGTAIAQAKYLNGCVQYLVQPKGLKDSEIIGSVWIDEGQLIVTLAAENTIIDGNEIGPGGGVRNHP